MGIDIHAYVEIDESGEFDCAGCVRSLTASTFFLDRDYEIFDALAGAREFQMEAADQDPKRYPLIPPRGMSAHCSHTVLLDFYFLVDDPINPKGPPNEYFWPNHRCIDPIEAEKWAKNPGCLRTTIHQSVFPEQDWPAISPPGLTCPTWLTPLEFDASLAHHEIEIESLPFSYRLLRMTLHETEKEYGAGHVRLVLWFDH